MKVAICAVGSQHCVNGNALPSPQGALEGEGRTYQTKFDVFGVG
jgi:hypothetical protein